MSRSPRGRAAALAALALGAVLLLPGAGVGGPGGGAAPAAAPGAAVERLRVEVREVVPHDPGAFTQGLELHGGVLYESTGLAGRSSVTAGPPGAAPTVAAALPAPLFGEGLTRVGSVLWQLTWRDGIAIERDARTLAELRRVRYRGEGWGLCHQPGHGRLVMSDGGDRLTFRDPGDFSVTGGIDVTARGQPVRDLNELECVGGSVYANIWRTDTIARIDAATGSVTAWIDASALPEAGRRREVLNGIAALPGGEEFWITGKLWPSMYRVAFVPV